MLSVSYLPVPETHLALFRGKKPGLNAGDKRVGLLGRSRTKPCYLQKY
jgi:hypothetical protein